MPAQTPKYRLHKPTQQAVVTIAGKDFYLGRYGSTTSRIEFDRLVAAWLANGHNPIATADRTVGEVMVGYVEHAESYYRKDGRPTSQVTLIKLTLKGLERLYGHTSARDFGPLALKAVRQAYIDSGLCRTEVNRRTGLVIRFFEWAVENEPVPSSVHHGLVAVAGLRKGRTDVREPAPVKPGSDTHVCLQRVPRSSCPATKSGQSQAKVPSCRKSTS
jgi:hypothetical protein